MLLMLVVVVVVILIRLFSCDSNESIPIVYQERSVFRRQGNNNYTNWWTWSHQIHFNSDRAQLMYTKTVCLRINSWYTIGGIGNEIISQFSIKYGREIVAAIGTMPPKKPDNHKGNPKRDKEKKKKYINEQTSLDPKERRKTKTNKYGDRE